jgi:hypothetical protein
LLQSFMIVVKLFLPAVVPTTAGLS